MFLVLNSGISFTRMYVNDDRSGILFDHESWRICLRRARPRLRGRAGCNFLRDGKQNRFDGICFAGTWNTRR